MRSLLRVVLGLVGFVAGFYVAGVAARPIVSGGLAQATAERLLTWTVVAVLGGVIGALLGGALAKQLCRLSK